jgi:hypothetical protein
MSSGTLINQIDQISSNLNDCYGPKAVKLSLDFYKLDPNSLLNITSSLGASIPNLHWA